MSAMAEPKAMVFVVDDDVSVREGLGSLIRSAGLRVETFTSAQEFLARPRADVPSCLVLDVRLPGLSDSICRSEWPRSRSRFPLFSLRAMAMFATSVRAMKAGSH